MAPLGCALIDLSGGRDLPTATAVSAHLAAVRERLGPETPVDVLWPGEPVPDLPPLVRLTRGPAARALATAAARVASSGGHLLVLFGAVLPAADVLERLLAGLALDPLVGFAQPRFTQGADALWPLPGATDAAGPLPRHVEALLPEHYLTTERLAACLVARREAVAGFAADPAPAASLPEALQSELCRARRRGFRNLVLNRVAVEAAAGESPYPRLDPRARSALEARHPDATTADELFTGAAHQRFERVVAHARRPRPGAAVPVLLDCRGVPARHNGTSEAILGLLAGVRELAPAWETDLLFRPDAAEYHRCSSGGGLRVLTALPERSYAAAVRLDQPWHLSTVAELHRRACVVSFHMLDTIAWDIASPAAREAERAWRFVAERSDGLLFNSAFTQARFEFRFPTASDVLRAVTHHATGTARTPARRDAPGEHLLVFGNDLEHKAVAVTVDVLRRGFPYQPIVAVGPTALEEGRFLTSFSSGRLPAEQIERLVASARVVVFPSFYEGFGLPVVQALALGRPVVVRASPLWREIAGICRGPGRLLEFVAPHELVELVARTIEGERVPGLPLGAALGPAQAVGWRDCAARIVDHVERAIAGFDGRRWFAREHALEVARP